MMQTKDFKVRAVNITSGRTLWTNRGGKLSQYDGNNTNFIDSSQNGKIYSGKQRFSAALSKSSNPTSKELSLDEFGRGGQRSRHILVNTAGRSDSVDGGIAEVDVAGESDTVPSVLCLSYSVRAHFTDCSNVWFKLDVGTVHVPYYNYTLRHYL